MLMYSNIVNRLCHSPDKLLAFGTPESLQECWQILEHAIDYMKPNRFVTRPYYMVDMPNGSEFRGINMEQLGGGLHAMTADVIYILDDPTEEYFDKIIKPIWVSGTHTEIYRLQSVLRIAGKVMFA